MRLRLVVLAGVVASSGAAPVGAQVPQGQGNDEPAGALPSAPRQAPDPFEIDGAEGAPTPVSRSGAPMDPFDRDDADGAVAAARAVRPEPAPSQVLATVRFRNGVDKFQLLEARFVMDGAELPVLASLDAGKDAVIFAGKLRPGRHVVNAHIVYQGERRGLFTYLKGYKLNVESEQVLTVPEDRSIAFTIAAEQHKRMGAPIEKQLAIIVVDDARQAAARR